MLEGILESEVGEAQRAHRLQVLRGRHVAKVGLHAAVRHAELARLGGVDGAENVQRKVAARLVVDADAVGRAKNNLPGLVGEQAVLLVKVDVQAVFSLPTAQYGALVGAAHRLRLNDLLLLIRELLGLLRGGGGSVRGSGRRHVLQHRHAYLAQALLILVRLRRAATKCATEHPARQPERLHHRGRRRRRSGRLLARLLQRPAEQEAWQLLGRRRR
mmetsp:Transcript_38998/g.99725  ORF Transcript_38998/g.99725 Transcript_38998/m.99725 type:complete len:216 (+) Transcript_38998:446-1093(+)